MPQSVMRSYASHCTRFLSTQPKARATMYSANTPRWAFDRKSEYAHSQNSCLRSNKSVIFSLLCRSIDTAHSQFLVHLNPAVCEPCSDSNGTRLCSPHSL